jgi:hypothetical protein
VTGRVGDGGGPDGQTEAAGDAPAPAARFQPVPRADADPPAPLPVPARREFDGELDGIQARIDRVVAAGRTDFGEGSPSYDVASMAIIRFAALLEVKRFAGFLAALTDTERRGATATRNFASHSGYRAMDEGEFWHTVTVDLPALIARLR